MPGILTSLLVGLGFYGVAKFGFDTVAANYATQTALPWAQSTALPWLGTQVTGLIPHLIQLGAFLGPHIPLLGGLALLGPVGAFALAALAIVAAVGLPFLAVKAVQQASKAGHHLAEKGNYAGLDRSHERQEQEARGGVRHFLGNALAITALVVGGLAILPALGLIGGIVGALAHLAGPLIFAGIAAFAVSRSPLGSMLDNAIGKPLWNLAKSIPFARNFLEKVEERVINPAREALGATHGASTMAESLAKTGHYDSKKFHMDVSNETSIRSAMENMTPAQRHDFEREIAKFHQAVNPGGQQAANLRVVDHAIQASHTPGRQTPQTSVGYGSAG
jgi:hypothetical protein